MPLAPGDVFAGYRVVRQLGSGGMGAVYLVRHPRLPRVEALKALRPEYSTDADFARRFLREAEVVVGLEHRNIVPVLDRGEDEGRLWLTMRYVDGIDAEEALAAAGGLLPAQRAVRIVGEVAAALDCAHRSHLVHRDVKPANVLLSRPEPDEPEHVFLTDFGIAKSLSADTRLTRTGMVVATFEYASPEQIESRPLDARTDVYSLGCLLHKLLTGSVPFPGSSVAAALHGHLALPPPRPSSLVPWLPPGLDGVVARAMAKDPADRYPSCRALAADARAALDGYPELPPGDLRVGITAAGGPALALDTGSMAAADRDRLLQLLRRTRFFDLPETLAGTTPAPGPAGPAADRVTVEVSGGGRTHRVVADLATARRPPELADLVDTVRELGTAAAPRPPAPRTVVEPPRPSPPPGRPPTAPALPRAAATGTPRAAGTAAGTGATATGPAAGPAGTPAATPAPVRRLPEHPPPPPSRGPVTPAPWLNRPPPGDAGPPAAPAQRPAASPSRPTGAPGPRGPASRRRAVVAIAAVAALAGAGATTWVLARGDDGGGGDGGTTGAGTTPPGDTPSDAAAAALAALPTADPLPATAVVLAREVDGAADLYAVDGTTGEQVIRLTDDPAPDVSPVLLPGRGSVVYGRAGDAGLEWRVVAADGSGDRALFPDGPADCPDPGRPTFDPTDPTRLAVVCRPADGPPSLRLLTLDGAPVVTLHESEAVLDDPAFSPDGSRVAFYAGNDPDRDGGALYVVAVDTPGVATAVTEGEDGEDADPSWSPDGQQLAWRREIVPGNRAIVVGSPDEVGNALILTSGTFDQDPVWSPDGATIAFKSDRDGDAAPAGEQLWLMDADGSDSRQLPFDDGVMVDAPAWADHGG
ncbi:protein kinase domain-containing protein [Trujillonella humicola]|uniref:protein kinase domain-containing protein n=1 Tax=Trujillonella humicola TaxID=3383699 RepID=UPI00390653B3